MAAGAGRRLRPGAHRQAPLARDRDRRGDAPPPRGAPPALALRAGARPLAPSPHGDGGRRGEDHPWDQLFDGPHAPRDRPDPGDRRDGGFRKAARHRLRPRGRVHGRGPADPQGSVRRLPRPREKQRGPAARHLGHAGQGRKAWGRPQARRPGGKHPRETDRASHRREGAHAAEGQAAAGRRRPDAPRVVGRGRGTARKARSGAGPPSLRRGNPDLPARRGLGRAPTRPRLYPRASGAGRRQARHPDQANDPGRPLG